MACGESNFVYAFGVGAASVAVPFVGIYRRVWWAAAVPPLDGFLRFSGKTSDQSLVLPMRVNFGGAVRFIGYGEQLTFQFPGGGVQTVGCLEIIHACDSVSIQATNPAQAVAVAVLSWI